MGVSADCCVVVPLDGAIDEVAITACAPEFPPTSAGATLALTFIAACTDAGYAVTEPLCDPWAATTGPMGPRCACRGFCADGIICGMGPVAMKNPPAPAVLAVAAAWRGLTNTAVVVGGTLESLRNPEFKKSTLRKVVP